MAGFAAGAALASAPVGDFHAPATISAGGREALATFSRANRNAPLPAPGEIAGWRRVQAEVETRRETANAAVVQAYQAGIAVKLDPYEGMWHIFQVFTHDIPEAKLA